MPNVVWVDLDKLDLKADTPVQMFDLESDFEANGEVSKHSRPAKPVEFRQAGVAVQWQPAHRKQYTHGRHHEPPVA